MSGVTLQGMPWHFQLKQRGQNVVVREIEYTRPRQSP
jgi:hypothetical protein